jgi:hypothetical protein
MRPRTKDVVGGQSAGVTQDKEKQGRRIGRRKGEDSPIFKYIGIYLNNTCLCWEKFPGSWTLHPQQGMSIG